MKPTTLRLLTLSVGLAVALGACGSSASTSPPATQAPQTVLAATATPAATPAPTAVSTPAPAATPTPAATPAPAGLAGQWSGKWQDTSPDTGGGTFALTWTQSGNTLAGSITVHGAPCLTTGTVTGTLNGSAISFGAVSGQVKITYDGSYSGNTMQGTYSAPGCGNAKGNWSATKS